MTERKTINSPILGRNIYLSGGRIVFMGRFEDSDSWGLAFRNEKGEDKYLMLTEDAFWALVTLVDDRNNVSWTEDFPHKKVWHVMAQTDVRYKEIK